MTSRNQLIFDKPDSIHSKTKECKNISHTLRLKSSEILFIKGFFFKIQALYFILNSYEKLTLMDLSLWIKLTHL
jgi:hypothetical protein